MSEPKEPDVTEPDMLASGKGVLLGLLLSLILWIMMGLIAWWLCL
jgi:hypothetical protein